MDTGTPTRADDDRPFIILRDDMFAEVEGNWRILHVKQVSDAPDRFRIGGHDYDGFGEPLTPGAPAVIARCDFRGTTKHGNKAVMQEFAKRLEQQRSGYRPEAPRQTTPLPTYSDDEWSPDMKLRDAPRDLTLSIGCANSQTLITTPAELMGEGRFSGHLTIQDVFEILNRKDRR